MYIVIRRNQKGAIFGCCARTRFIFERAMDVNGNTINPRIRAPGSKKTRARIPVRAAACTVRPESNSATSVQHAVGNFHPSGLRASRLPVPGLTYRPVRYKKRRRRRRRPRQKRINEQTSANQYKSRVSKSPRHNDVRRNVFVNKTNV